MEHTRSLLILGLAHSLNHSLFLVLPPLMTLVASDLGAGFSEMGMVSTIAFLTYGAGALVGGPLSDRVGSLKVAQASIGLAGAATLVFLLADSVEVFGVGMFLMALWASFYHPTANGLIAKAFPEDTGRSMGLHNAAGNLGQVLTPTLGYLVGVRFGWRFSFLLFGALSILTAVLLNQVRVEEEPSQGSKGWELGFLLSRGLPLVLLYNVVVGALFRSVDLFYPSYLSLEKSYSGTWSALGNSLVLLFGVAGQVLGGWCTDRFGGRRVLLVATAGMVASLVLLLASPAYLGVPLFTLLYGVSMFAHQPTATSLVSKVSPREYMGLAFGVMFFSAFGVGSLSTSVAGRMADAYGLGRVFAFNAGLSLLALLVSALVYFYLDAE